MPALEWKLRQPRSMAEHALEQVVGDLDARARPRPLDAVVAAREDERDHDPQDEHHRLGPPSRPEHEDDARQDQVDERQHREQGAADRKLLDDLGLGDAAEMAADAVEPHLVGGQLEGSREQLLLQQRSEPDREHALPPHLEHAQRNRARDHGDPPQEPAGLEVGLERGATEQPERASQHQREERVAHEDAGGERRDVAEQRPPARGAPGAHDPAGAQLRLAEPLQQHL
ncbi:hypothetical protein OV208_40605 [Corallococcus sp. bb12-1]|uniref:hypothetical protein n=1 Tax=Corallococcus sp. bb12-1 TaxID=2996784 RepID=UPI002271E573|nr:hypothetical protein [Corallococcus sp. bb12-1]MCY1047668.1 hypothetical protein [Corallococcus sp. bb12-1]